MIMLTLSSKSARCVWHKSCLARLACSEQQKNGCLMFNLWKSDKTMLFQIPCHAQTGTLTWKIGKVPAASDIHASAAMHARKHDCCCRSHACVVLAAVFEHCLAGHPFTGDSVAPAPGGQPLQAQCTPQHYDQCEIAKAMHVPLQQLHPNTALQGAHTIKTQWAVQDPDGQSLNEHNAFHSMTVNANCSSYACAITAAFIHTCFCRAFIHS